MKWLLLVLLIIPPAVYAEVYERYRLNGFVSTRVNIASEDTSDFDKALDFKKQNILGLQLTGVLSDNARVTIVASSRGGNDYEINVDWAYLTYVLPNDWLINFGRLGIPYYLYSDVKDIGFTYDWLYLPKSVYRFTYSIIDGVSVYHNGQYGDVNTTFQVMYGGFEGDVTVVGLPAKTELDQFVGIFTAAEWKQFYVRIALSRTNVNVEPQALQPVFSALRQDIFDAFWTNGVDAYFRGVAFRYRYNNLTVLSEYVSVDIRDSFFDKRNGGYLSVSYDIKGWHPYVTFEHEDFKVARDKIDFYKPEVPVPIYAVMSSLMDFEQRRKTTLHVGFRYDYNLRSALKIQYSREHNHRSTVGAVNVISLGVDVVF